MKYHRQFLKNISLFLCLALISASLGLAGCSSDDSELDQEIAAVTKEINSLNLKENLGDEEKQQIDEIMDKVKNDDKDNLSALISDLNTLVQYKIKEDEKEISDASSDEKAAEDKEKAEEKKEEEAEQKEKDAEQKAEDLQQQLDDAKAEANNSDEQSASVFDTPSTDTASNSGAAEHMCRDGMAINYDANVHAKGRANACYGHKGFAY